MVGHISKSMIVPGKESFIARRHLGNCLYDFSQFSNTFSTALCFSMHVFSVGGCVSIDFFLFLINTSTEIVGSFLINDKICYAIFYSLTWNDLEKSCMSHIDANLLVFLSSTSQSSLKSLFYNTNHIHWDSTHLIVINQTYLSCIQHFPLWKSLGLKIYIYLLS